MADLPALIAGFTPDQMQAALQVLDTVSRPLTVREIEQAMAGRGVSRTQRKIISKAIERLHIVALVRPEHHG